MFRTSKRACDLPLSYIRTSRKSFSNVFRAQIVTLFLDDLPDIKPYDDAMMKRAKVIGYSKAFVDEPSNIFELKKALTLTKK